MFRHEVGLRSLGVAYETYEKEPESLENLASGDEDDNIF